MTEWYESPDPLRLEPERTVAQCQFAWLKGYRWPTSRDLMFYQDPIQEARAACPYRSRVFRAAFVDGWQAAIAEHENFVVWGVRTELTLLPEVEAMEAE